MASAFDQFLTDMRQLNTERFYTQALGAVPLEGSGFEDQLPIEDDPHA